MAPHSSTLAWKIPWTEEPGRLQSMGSLRVGHNWSDLACFWSWTTSSLSLVDLIPSESGASALLIPMNFGSQWWLFFLMSFFPFSKLLYVCSRGLCQVLHLLAWLRKFQIHFSNLEFKDLNSWESNSCRPSQSPVVVRECAVVLSYGFWCHNGLYAVLDLLYIHSLSVCTFAMSHSDNFYDAF